MEPKILVHSKDILWNDQKNNQSVGFIKADSECGYTALTRVMAQVDPVRFNNPDEKVVDAAIAALIDDMETRVGKKGWGEKFVNTPKGARFKNVERLGAFLDVYEAYLKDFAEPFGYTTVCKLVGGTWEEVEYALMLGLVVMIGTKITSHGHFICVVGEEGDYYICLDPYGDASTNYKVKIGNRVKYKKAWLKERCFDGANKPGKVRFLRLTLKT